MIAISALLVATNAAFGHIVLAEPAALAHTSNRAAFRVGHGCNGAATTAIRVSIPAGFQGAKPMPHAGWVLAVKEGKLDKPYQNHGKTVTHDVTEVTWTASAKEHALPDAFYDEFVLRGTLPAVAGPMWFKILQTCDALNPSLNPAGSSNDWSQVPANPASVSTQGLKSPAALLEVIASEQVGHQH